MTITTNLDAAGVLWVYTDQAEETFTLSGYLNVNGIVCGDNVDLHGVDAWIDGNDVAGTIAISSADDDFEVTGEILVTNFSAGIYSGGQNCAISGAYRGAIEMSNLNGVYAVGVSGGSLVQNVYAHDIGYGTANAFGVVGWGGGNNFYHDDVANLSGYYESVGYSMGYGGTIWDCTATNAANMTGWGYGFWAGAGGSYTVTASSFTGFDVGVGVVAPITLSGTYIRALQTDLTTHDPLIITDAGGNDIATGATSSGPYIYGTSGIDHIVGDANSNTIVGSGGADVLFGGAGADTFIFSSAAMSVAPDYDKVQGDDIYLAYHYPTSVITFDTGRHVLMVDGVDYVYLPGVGSLADVGYHF